MAELIPQVMFLKGNTPPDYSDLEIAELNLELQGADLPTVAIFGA
jgi:hypothetical protein